MRVMFVFLCVCFSLQLCAQRSNKAWSNPKNYKEEVVESIKRSPQLINPKLYFGKEIQTHLGTKKVITKSEIKNIPFVNGINIAWINFGRDVGYDPLLQTKYRPEIEKFDEVMSAVSQAGGNVVRWWYHTNGSTNPVFDQNQKVIDNPDFFYEDVKSILDLAVSKKIKVQICLWSFDMLKDQWNVDAVANKKILTEEAYYQSYIDKALIPLVNQIGDHPGLFAWEIFNEAEGMTNEYGSHWPDFKEKISIIDVQKFINRTAAVIRKEQPSVKITNGALGFLTSVDDPEKGFQNLYADQKLQEIGGEQEGYLDFYNIHYYSWAGVDGSPFHNVYDPEKMDKQAIIAEYYPDSTFGVDVVDIGVSLLEKGWHGSLLWSWTDRPWDAMESVLARVSDYMRPLENIDTTDIVMYPNPTVGRLNVIGLQEETEITIIDAVGKTIKKMVYNPAARSIDISSLANGIYYVKVSDGFFKKILKFN